MERPAPSSLTSKPSLTATFRSQKKSTRLHPLEIAVIACIGAHLVFLPWALGSMRLWSQLMSLALAASGFALALVPRTHRDEFSSDGRPYRTVPVKRLLAFPGFWLGLFLLIYATVQGLNPAWTFVSLDAGGWRMDPIDSIAWLPSGADTPFTRWNSARSLVVWSSAWLLGCTVWIGLNRRASIRALLTIVALNAGVLAAVGILQHIAGNGKILWLIPASTSYTVATFPYKNHAGAFFNLGLAATAVIGVWSFERAQRRALRTSPAPLFAVCAVVIALMIALSFSRAATLLMLAFVALAIAVGVVRVFRSPRRPNLILVAVFVIALGGAGALGARHLRVERAADGIQRLLAQDRAQSVELRQLAAHATWDMARDRLATGWGAGSFRFLFPLYQQNYPQIYQPAWAPDRSFHFEHAHNDYLQSLAELGVIGCAPLVALLGWWLARLFQARVWRNSGQLLLTAGLAGLLAHCWIDFNLQNPAILLTAVALGTLGLRWSELQARRSR